MENIMRKVNCTTNLFIKKKKYIEQSMKYHTICGKIINIYIYILLHE